MILDVNKVKLVALYTGNKGYKFCTCKCPCCSQKNVGGNYQGTIEQVNTLLDIFTGLTYLYLFGNPDPTVDTEFCNEAARVAIKRGKNVSFSTSGVGGLKKIKQLLYNIPTEVVGYVSYSIDTVNPEKMSMLKGVKYPWNNAIEGIKWTIRNGYKTKIQPTLWSSNYEDVYSIIEYISKLGVDWFSFHIGSIENNNLPTHNHLTVEQMKFVHAQIDKAAKEYGVHVECPTIYSECGNNNPAKWYCMNPDICYNWLAFLKENGVYATHVPILSEFDDKYCYDITKPIEVEKMPKSNYCPASSRTASVKTLCRYISKTWN